MKASHFYISIGVAVICLALTIALIAAAQGNQHLQIQLQGQQRQLNLGNMSQQLYQGIAQDIANGYKQSQDEKLKDLLARNGFTLTEAAANPPSPAPAQ